MRRDPARLPELQGNYYTPEGLGLRSCEREPGGWGRCYRGGLNNKSLWVGELESHGWTQALLRWDTMRS